MCRGVSGFYRIGRKWIFTLLGDRRIMERVGLLQSTRCNDVVPEPSNSERGCTWNVLTQELFGRNMRPTYEKLNDGFYVRPKLPSRCDLNAV